MIWDYYVWDRFLGKNWYWKMMGGLVKHLTPLGVPWGILSSIIKFLILKTIILFVGALRKWWKGVCFFGRKVCAKRLMGAAHIVFLFSTSSGRFCGFSRIDFSLPQNLTPLRNHLTKTHLSHFWLIHVFRTSQASVFKSCL